jgi:hypothetical protein
MMRNGMSVLALAAVGVIATAAPVYAVIIPSTGAAGGTDDANWSVLWRPIAPDGISFGADSTASLVTSIPSPPWQPNVSGNNWLGIDDDATIPGATGDNSHRYEYAFTTEITLPVPQTLTGVIGFDNFFFVGGFLGGSFDPATGTYTPGTQFLSPTSLLGPGNENKAGFCRDADGFLPSSSFPACTVDFAFDLPAGDYTITFVIQGDGLTDGFILNQQDVALVSEPATVGLLGLALGAVGLAQRRRVRGRS